MKVYTLNNGVFLLSLFIFSETKMNIFNYKRCNSQDRQHKPFDT